MQVTGEQVCAAMVAANITRVDHHDCAGCGAMVFYSREGDQLFFNPGCDCGRAGSPAEPRDWSDAADWINMQSSLEWRNKLRSAFGLPPDVRVPAVSAQARSEAPTTAMSTMDCAKIK